MSGWAGPETPRYFPESGKLAVDTQTGCIRGGLDGNLIYSKERLGELGQGM